MDCFMNSEYEEPCKWVDVKETLEIFKVNGLLSIPISGVLPLQPDNDDIVTLESGNYFYKEIIDAMKAIQKLPKISMVNGNITSVTRLELCLSLKQVNLGMVQEKKIGWNKTTIFFI